MEFSPKRKLDIYYKMLLSRRLDERAWMLHRQNRIAFHMSAIGHEAVQLAAGFALQKGTDWVAPYPRDLTLMLALGLTPAGYIKMLMGKPNEMDASGRQMPGNWSLPEANVISISGIVASHIPHAVGIAHAIRLRAESSAVLASCGEGATSMGAWYEAVNWAVVHKLPVVFLVQNNGFALSTRLNQQTLRSSSYKASAAGLPVQKVDGTDLFKVYAALSGMLEDARANNGPGLVEALVMRIPPHSSDDDDRTYRTREEVEDARRQDPLHLLRKQLVREGVLTREFLSALEAKVKVEVDEAVLEAENADFPDPLGETASVFAVGEGLPTASVSQPTGEDPFTLRDSIHFILDQAMEEDEQVVLLGMDIGVKGGVFRVTEGLYEKFGPERVIDAPLSGEALIGTAVGMALYGMRPVVEVQFADFLSTAFTQIVAEAARMFYRSSGAWKVPLVIRVPYGGGISGGLYHSQSVEAFFTHVPGLKVIIPSNPLYAAGLLRSALHDPNPVLFLEPKKGYRSLLSRRESEEIFEPAGVGVTHPGVDVSVICYGMMHAYALEAAFQLAPEDISVEVVNVRVLQPLDMEAILESVKKTGKVLIVYEDNLSGGFGAEIAAQIAEHGFLYLDAPVKRLAGPDVPGVPFSPKLQEWFMVNTEKIKDAVRALIRF